MDTGPLETVHFQSSDISGDGDVDRVETTLSGINGVRDVEVDPNGHTVEVRYDPTEVNKAKLEEALIAEGYSVGGKDDAGGGLPEGTGSPAQSGTGLADITDLG